MGAIDTHHFAAQLLADLPDLPRWIETRAMLRSPHVEMFAGPVLADGVVLRLLHDAMSVVSVVGRPQSVALASALEETTPMTPVIAQPENASHVAALFAEIAPSQGVAWRPERMLFHSLESVPALPALAADISIRLVDTTDPIEHLPSGLRHEIAHARVMTETAAAFVDGVAASFCYACFTTESLWDVSIDTVEAYRGRGLAAHTVRFMIDRMRERRLEPVWAALESNGPSLRLAARLGFTPVEPNIVFARGAWAYLTRGYTG